MNSFLTALRGWLNQTSTKTAVLSIASVSASLVTHAISRNAAVAAIIPAAVGLVFSDQTLVATVSSSATPAVQAFVAKPTLATLESQAVAAVPAVVATVPQTPTVALAEDVAATLIAGHMAPTVH